MTQHHVNMLHSLANMEYMVNQIHARTPMHDQHGTPITDFMSKARHHISLSALDSNGGNHIEALKNMRTGAVYCDQVMGALSQAITNQAKDVTSLNPSISQSTVLNNLKDAEAAADHWRVAVSHGQKYANEVAEKMPQIVEEKKQEIRDATDNAREVIDSIADEQNLNLPGNWDRHGDEPAPNGE